MPYLSTASEWLTQSHLLLQARPTTTRITTKYTIKPPPDPSAPSKRKSKAPSTTTSEPTTIEPSSTTTPAQAPDPIRATLTLKTYDSVSGSTLKYETTKAAEVSRLIQILGKLGRGMAGLPEVKEDVVMGDVGGEVSGVATPVVGDGTSTPVGGKVGQQLQQGGGQGGKGKKKKGKK